MASGKDESMSELTDHALERLSNLLAAGNINDRDEMLRLEQLCLEQAELCATSEGKQALRHMAATYHQAAIDQVKLAQ
jgi:hypothetical protein